MLDPWIIEKLIEEEIRKNRKDNFLYKELEMPVSVDETETPVKNSEVDFEVVF